jgi:hypothetical protein
MNATAKLLLYSTVPELLVDDPSEFPQVIRRDLPGDISGKPRVVPWLGHKIARAVAAPCVAERKDESIGRQVQVRSSSD